MKVCIGIFPLLVAFCTTSVEAFAPDGTRRTFRKSTARSLSPIDLSSLHELPHQIDSFQNVMSTLSIADMDAAAEATKSNSGGLGFLTGPTIGFLQWIHAGLNALGVKNNSWGVSIIVLTMTIKLATYPLTKTQLESTQKMQTLQPTIKEIQAKYQSNPEVMNKKIAEIYQSNDVNPLAGCLPVLFQLPVFVGLYRAVLDLANENALDESFLWLPSLEGPIYGADPAKGSAWLFDNWANGAPSLGWEDTIAFLILPVFLVISQFLSVELMTPKEQKEQQPSFLKALPLMIGFFSLNVPSALCIYWVTNNIVTTATSLIIKNSIKMEPVVAGATVETTASSVVTENVFSPPTIREKPAGFANGTLPSSSSGVTPLTSSEATVDAEILTEVRNEPLQAPESFSPKKKRGKKRKKRRKN